MNRAADNTGRRKPGWKIKAAAAALAAALLLTGCGGKSSSANYSPQKDTESSYDYAASGAAMATEEAAAEYEEDAYPREEPESGEGTGLRQAQDGEKIIYTANLEIQTLGYDETVKSIRGKIGAAGGFIEAEYESDNNHRWYEEDSGGSTRYLSLTIRIPSEKFDAFLNSLEGDGKVISRSVNARNISRVYADTDASKKALEVEQARLLEMMDRAETIEEMILVEKRLSEVERELNSYRTELSGMDRDVEYSTIYLNLQEVKRYSRVVEEVSFGTRLREAAEDAIIGFKEFMEDLTLFVVGNFPFLIILAIVIILLVRGIRRRRERRAIMYAAAGRTGQVNIPEDRKRKSFRRRGASEKEAPVPEVSAETPEEGTQEQ